MPPNESSLPRKFLGKGAYSKKQSRFNRHLGDQASKNIKFCKTRWNSWILAVKFITMNYDKVLEFFVKEATDGTVMSRYVVEYMEKNETLVSCRMITLLLSSWTDLLKKSEGVDSFDTSCLIKIRMLEREMIDLSTLTAKEFAPRFCDNMPDEMIDWTEKMLTKCSKKACTKFKTYVAPTLANVRHRLLFTPSEASLMELPNILPPEDLNGELCIGELGMAWRFYREGIEKETWMEEDRVCFWSSVVDSNAKADRVIMMPLFKTIVERSLCSITSEACVESIFSKMRDLITRKKFNLSDRNHEIELLVLGNSTFMELF